MVVFFCCLTFKINVAFGIVLVDFIGLDNDDALDLVENECVVILCCFMMEILFLCDNV
jgi:hypothetical protein